MSLFYENVEKRDSFGKLGVIIIKDTKDLDLLSKKSSYFRDLDVEILIVSRLLPNDQIYSNCNFLIYDSLSKRSANDIIYEFVTDKKFTKILLYNKFVEEINVIGTSFDQFLHEQEKVSNTQEKFTVNFLSGAYLSISFPYHRSYYAQFWDKKTNKILYSCDMWNGGWAMTVIKYFIDYNIKVFDKLTDELLWDYHIDFSKKNIFVNFESSALGDTIAWMNSIDDFIEKHACNLILSTFHNHLFQQEYPHIKFVNPGEAVHGIFAQYNIGWFYREDSSVDTNFHPRDFRTIPLHQTTSDILGVDFVQRRPKIKIPELPKPIEDNYVVISPYSTTQAKFWNNTNGWKDLVEFFVGIGWKVVVISKEKNGYMNNYFPDGVIDKTGDYPLESRINDIRWSRMFIGLGSGLTWLAWATGVPQTIISGFSEPWTEPTGDDILRIHNPSVCNSCFNRERLDAGDWMWCPDKKNTPEQFICTKSISSSDVISKISQYFQFSISEKTNNLSLVKAIMSQSGVKNITLFTSNNSIKNSMLEDFDNFFEKGVDCVFTDKPPLIAYNLFKNLVRKDGLLIFYNLEDFTYIENLSCRKLIYKGDETVETFVILFL